MLSKRAAPALGTRTWRDTRREWLSPATAAPTAPDAPVVAKSELAPHAAAFAWRPVVLQAASFWLATRLMYAIVVYFALVLLGQGHTSHLDPQQFLASWQLWDANWYRDIAVKGYYSTASSVFFPLFPLMIRAGIVIGLNPTVAGLVAGNLGTLLAFAGIALFAINEDGDVVAGTRTLRLVVAYPLAFFLVAIYGDGLFIGLAALTLYFARRGQWRAVALCALLAGLTRPTSIALILPVLWEFGRQHGWWQRVPWRERLARIARPRVLLEGALAVGAVPAGFALYAFYCWRHFGDPFSFSHAQKQWDHYSQYLPLWKVLPASLYHLWTAPPLSVEQARTLVDFVPFVVVAAVTIYCIRREPLAFTLYVGGLLLLTVMGAIPHGSDFLQSSGRYMLEAVPTFLLIGRGLQRRPTLEFVVLGGGFLIQAVLLTFYLTGGLII
jgi:hypothetical protein